MIFKPTCYHYATVASVGSKDDESCGIMNMGSTQSFPPGAMFDSRDRMLQMEMHYAWKTMP